MRTQLFIYGSCVARDIVRVTEGKFGVVQYVARQSWISAATKGLPRPDASRLSPFSARSLMGDFASNLPYLLRREGRKADVILIDLASDRHGVYPHGEGFITNSGELRRSGQARSVRGTQLVEFGSSEHRRLFRLAANKLKRVLVSAGLFERVLVLNAPFAGESDDGREVPLARGLTSNEINEKYSYYYHLLAQLGFFVLPVPPADLVKASSSHKWGLQQDHYVDELYYWWADQIDAFVDQRRVLTLGNTE